ncbi:hypothetical protein Tco_0300271 [Tanacetum coccineum]
MGSKTVEVPALKENEFTLKTVLGILGGVWNETYRIRHISYPSRLVSEFRALSFALMQVPTSFSVGIHIRPTKVKILPVGFHRHENSPNRGIARMDIYEVHWNPHSARQFFMDFLLHENILVDDEVTTLPVRPAPPSPDYVPDSPDYSPDSDLDFDPLEDDLPEEDPTETVESLPT